jgi:hypothetical protein
MSASDFERMIDQRSLISVTQNTECASHRKPTTLRHRSPSSFVDDQHVRLLFCGQLASSSAWPTPIR